MSPQELSRREQALHDRLRAEIGGPYHEDGAVDPKQYVKARARICFVLKEVNRKKDDEDWPLREHILDGAQGPTWNMVFYWVYGLLHGRPSWEDLPDATPESRQTHLAQVAVLNLNKNGGASRSIPARIRAAAARASDVLRAHIKLLAPEVLIAAGDVTGDVLARVVYCDYESNWDKSNELVWVLRGRGDRPTIYWTYHPQAHMANDPLYQSLMATVSKRR